MADWEIHFLQKELYVSCNPTVIYAIVLNVHNLAFLCLKIYNSSKIRTYPTSLYTPQNNTNLLYILK